MNKNWLKYQKLSSKCQLDDQKCQLNNRNCQNQSKLSKILIRLGTKFEWINWLRLYQIPNIESKKIKIWYKYYLKLIFKCI